LSRILRVQVGYSFIGRLAAGLFADDGGDDAGWTLGVEFMPLDDGIGSAGGGVVSVVGAALGSVVAGAFPDGIASCAMAGAASIKEARTRIVFITGPFKRGYRATVTFESKIGRTRAIIHFLRRLRLRCRSAHALLERSLVGEIFCGARDLFERCGKAAKLVGIDRVENACFERQRMRRDPPVQLGALIA